MQDDNGQTALMIAAKLAHFECVSLLLSNKNIDILLKDKSGRMAENFCQSKINKFKEINQLFVEFREKNKMEQLKQEKSSMQDAKSKIAGLALFKRKPK